MKRRRIIGWCVAGVALLCAMAAACAFWLYPDYRTGKRLEQIESVIPKNADSALAMLRDMREASQGNRRNRALHALLTTMAIDKTGVYQSEDSLARVAYEYYDGGSDRCRKMLSEYYVGQIDLTNGRYAMALPHLMRAGDLADSQGDNLNSGLAYRTISDLYGECGMRSLELKYARLSYDRFKEGGSSLQVYADYSRLMLLNALSNRNDYRDAYKLALEMLKEEHPEFGGWRPTCYTVIGYYYLREGKLKDAMSVMEEMKASIRGLEYTSDQSRLLSMAYAANGELDSAAYYRDLTLGLDSLDYEPSYWTAFYSKDYDKALKEANNVIGSLGKSFDVLTSSQLPVIYEEYVKQKEREDALENRSRLLKYLLIGTAALLLISALSLYYRNVAVRRRLKVAELELVAQDMHTLFLSVKEELEASRRENESYASRSTDMKADLGKANSKVRDLYVKNREYRGELERLRGELLQFFYDKYHFWGDLAEMYYHEGEDSQFDRQFVDIVMKNLQSLSNGGEALDAIANEMDSVFDGIVTEVVKDYNLSLKQRNLFVYIAMGFSSRTISYLTGQPLASIYSTKSQFKKLIFSGKSKRKDEYIKFLRMDGRKGAAAD